MDGSVRRWRQFLPRIASHKGWEPFLEGCSSIGAGISMHFRGLSDDGSLTGALAWLRAVTGLDDHSGGIGHTLPFLIANFASPAGGSHCRCS